MRKHSLTASLLLLVLLTLAPAYSQDDPATLFEYCYGTASIAREDMVTYDRYVLEGEYPDMASAVDAVNTGSTVAQFHVTLPPVSVLSSAPSVDVVSESGTDIPGGAMAVAGGYIPTPSTILRGYGQTPAVARKTASGTTLYELLLAGDKQDGVTASIEIDSATAALKEMRIGGVDPDALIVRYQYDGDFAPSIVVTTFSNGGDSITRWTMVDVRTLEVPAPMATAIDAEPETPSPLAPANVVKGVQADVSFSDTLDTLPPVGVGNSSCNAQSGLCFNLVLVDVCFNVGLGFSLSTQTTIHMDGSADVEYPVDGQPGMASVSFIPSGGASSIDYSLSYSAELCGAFTFPIVGTCNAAARLASGSFTAAEGEKSFTSFLLPGATPRPICTGDTIAARTLGVNPGLSLCDLDLSLTGGLSVNPNLDYCISGSSIAVAPAGKAGLAKQVVEEGGTTLVAATAGPNTFNATWTGTPSLDGSVTLAPSLGISAPILGDLSVPFPSKTLNVPSLTFDDFTLTDSFDVDLQENTGGPGTGCFGAPNGGNPSFRPADASALLPMILGVLVLLSVRCRRHT